MIGPGRAGRSLAGALEASGWRIHGMLGRGDDVSRAAVGVDILVIATPDAAIASVAAAVVAQPDTVVAHLAGSLGLDVLRPHPRRAAIHPLVSLPDPTVGAERLRAGVWFATNGDPLARAVVDALRGRWFEVEDRDRARYHAAATIASNHLVALLDQVVEVAPGGVPLDAYLDLAQATLDNVVALGPANALTGPAARADTETIERHLDALPSAEHELYEVLSERCREIAAR